MKYYATYLSHKFNQILQGWAPDFKYICQHAAKKTLQNKQTSKDMVTVIYSSSKLYSSATIRAISQKRTNQIILLVVINQNIKRSVVKGGDPVA